MIATGSIEGTPYCTSLVATAFTQSVEPGIGTSSTLMPSFANQPILVAIAYGAAADDTVLAHHATRTFVCACAELTLTASAIADSRMAVLFISSLPLDGFFFGSFGIELLRCIPEQHAAAHEDHDAVEQQPQQRQQQQNRELS